MFLEPCVGLPYDVGLLGPPAEHQHGMHTFFSVAGEANDGGLPNPFDVVENALDVFGDHIEALRGDDDLLFATAYDQPSGRVELTDVAGVEPTALEGSSGFLI